MDTAGPESAPRGHGFALTQEIAGERKLVFPLSTAKASMAT